jgi:ABC-2 type transport system permease protein
MNALFALVRKDLVLYFSNKRALMVTLAAPILIAGFFGAVMGGPPKKPSRVPVAVVDLDASAVSKAIVAAMRADTSFELQEVTEPQALALVREGKVRAAAVIPASFGEQAPRAMFKPGAKKPEIVLHYDPSQAMTLAMVRGLLVQHVMAGVSKAAFNPQSGLTVIAQPGNANAPVEGFAMPFETRAAEVTSGVDRRYNGYAHSFAGMGVQFILFMGIEVGIGLLLMRRMGMWKRLRAAPVSRELLLGSRIVSGTLIATLLLVGIYAAGIAIFGVRIEGSVAGFVLVAVSFAILTSTFGLLIAALGKTPEATRGLAVLATLMLVMLGGAWVPTFVFPDWLQAATLVVPTRWAIDGLEATTWRGLGIEAAWKPAAATLAASALFAWIAMRRFAWDE